MDQNDISQEEFERIEAYINGNLTKSEVLEFETQLNTNSEFKTKFDDIKTVLTGIETQAMKEQLGLFHEELSANLKNPLVNEPKVKSLNWKRIAVAAVLVVGLGSFWLFSGSSNEKLYSEYFTPDPGLPTVMSNGNSNYEFYNAMVNYKQGDYSVAISKWQDLHKIKPSNDTLQYFIGVAHLANGNEAKAIEVLNSVLQFNDSNFKNDTYYYLGLAHLKANNLDLAKKNLNKSSLTNSKALLSELAD